MPSLAARAAGRADADPGSFVGRMPAPVSHPGSVQQNPPASRCQAKIILGSSCALASGPGGVDSLRAPFLLSGISSLTPGSAIGLAARPAGVYPAPRGSTFNLIPDCVIHNVWQRGIKGVPGVRKDGRLQPCRGCRVQYCLFYNDRPKRLDDDPYEAKNPELFGGNYIGGMDVMNARGWVVSDNVFLGIHGLTGEARGAIFFWNQSSDCVIERNIILDCDTGIYLGNGLRQPDTKVHCTRFIVRNNFVTRCPEGAITTTYTRDCKVVQNTIHDPTNKQRRSIRVVQDNDGLVIANNLCSSPPTAIAKNAAKVEARDNLERPVPEAFVDAAKENLHLTSKARGIVGRGAPLPDVREDIDHRPRGRNPTLGAHELRNSEGGNEGGRGLSGQAPGSVPHVTGLCPDRRGRLVRRPPADPRRRRRGRTIHCRGRRRSSRERPRMAGVGNRTPRSPLLTHRRCTGSPEPTSTGRTPAARGFPPYRSARPAYFCGRRRPEERTAPYPDWRAKVPPLHRFRGRPGSFRNPHPAGIGLAVSGRGDAGDVGILTTYARAIRRLRVLGPSPRPGR